MGEVDDIAHICRHAKLSSDKRVGDFLTCTKEERKESYPGLKLCSGTVLGDTGHRHHDIYMSPGNMYDCIHYDSPSQTFMRQHGRKVVVFGYSNGTTEKAKDVIAAFQRNNFLAPDVEFDYGAPIRDATEFYAALDLDGTTKSYVSYFDPEVMCKLEVPQTLAKMGATCLIYPQEPHLMGEGRSKILGIAGQFGLEVIQECPLDQMLEAYKQP